MFWIVLEFLNCFGLFTILFDMVVNMVWSALIWAVFCDIKFKHGISRKTIQGGSGRPNVSKILALPKLGWPTTSPSYGNARIWGTFDHSFHPLLCLHMVEVHCEVCYCIVWNCTVWWVLSLMIARYCAIITGQSSNNTAVPQMKVKRRMQWWWRGDDRWQCDRNHHSEVGMGSRYGQLESAAE